MQNITLQISDSDLKKIIEAYRTIQEFLEKVVSPNELYQEEFLAGLDEAQSDIAERNLTEVKNFADFIR